MSISVEKRSFPMSIGNTGVMLPSTMAWTAIGMSGVGVTAGVSVAAGEGVMTKEVAWLAAAVGVSRTAGAAARGEGVTVTAPSALGALGVLVVLPDAPGAAGAAGFVAGRFSTSKTAATATERIPTRRDQRALTTYLRRTR